MSVDIFGNSIKNEDGTLPEGIYSYRDYKEGYMNAVNNGTCPAIKGK